MIKVGIIGLGLIGGSILKALSKNNSYELFCYSNSSYKKALKYCKNASNNISIISDCDIIFVCCEVSKTLETLEELNYIVKKKTIVVDVSSIKTNLLAPDENIFSLFSIFSGFFDTLQEFNAKVSTKILKTLNILFFIFNAYFPVSS